MYRTAFLLIGLLAFRPIGLLAQTRATVIPAVVIGGVYDDNVSARAQADAGQMLQMRPSIEADYESQTLSLISLLVVRHAALESRVAEPARCAPPCDGRSSSGRSRP
jgi:hypothetical protein